MSLKDVFDQQYIKNGNSDDHFLLVSNLLYRNSSLKVKLRQYFGKVTRFEK